MGHCYVHFAFLFTLKRCGENRHLQAEVDSLKLECVASAANLKRTASREEYQRKKVAKIQQSTDCSRCGDYDALLRELEDMKKEATAKLKIVDEQAASIEWLEELLKENRVVQTKEGKAYTPKMMKCVMELLTDNVSACRVGQAIQAVLKLADMTACYIPSNATVFNYNVARLVLAQTAWRGFVTGEEHHTANR